MCRRDLGGQKINYVSGTVPTDPQESRKYRWFPIAQFFHCVSLTLLTQMTARSLHLPASMPQRNKHNKGKRTTVSYRRVRTPKIDIVADPFASAKLAGFDTSPTKAGHPAKRQGDSFAYFNGDGKRVRDKNTLVRIRRSRFRRPGPTSGSARRNGHSRPPAGTPAAGSSTATTRAGGSPRREQVRPDDRLRPRRCRGSASGRRDLKLPRPAREKVLATVVRLLETHADPRRQRGVRPRQTTRSA